MRGKIRYQTHRVRHPDAQLEEHWVHVFVSRSSLLKSISTIAQPCHEPYKRMKEFRVPSVRYSFYCTHGCIVKSRGNQNDERGRLQTGECNMGNRRDIQLKEATGYLPTRVLRNGEPSACHLINNSASSFASWIIINPRLNWRTGLTSSSFQENYNKLWSTSLYITEEQISSKMKKSSENPSRLMIHSTGPEGADLEAYAVEPKCPRRNEK